MIFKKLNKIKNYVIIILFIFIIVNPTAFCKNIEKNYSTNTNSYSDGKNFIENLKIEDIIDGLGLTIIFKNEGDFDITNITLDLEASGGIIVKLSENHFTIPILPAGQTTEQKIKISGFGLGLITEFPEITIVTSIKNSSKTTIKLISRVLGPFIKVVGTIYEYEDSFDGYTLFSPMISTSTFLINNSGDIVHEWDSNYRPRLSVYLLENGNLLRPGDLIPNLVFRMGGGNGGNVEIIDWNSTVLWDFEYSTDLYCLHHDVEILPNGNILMIAWEYKTYDESVTAGRNPELLTVGEMWPDHIIEVEPIGLNSGDIVWEWHVWDHLIQDFDPTKENYGVVGEHPELIDINYIGNLIFNGDWNHINSIDYNEEFDQILLTVNMFNEIWVIDHSTSTIEAAGHTGGNSGKGGDLLYRWGNPQTYRAGSSNDQKLFHTHDANWIESLCPGGGNILIFNNGNKRPDGDYSSVEEIATPVNESGVYYLSPGSAYGPENPIWLYKSEPPSDFFAVNLAGAQRLPNGNTLICNGPNGFFFEVTNEKEIVWEYLNTIPNLFDNHVFKIKRYAPDYPGLANLFN